MEPILASVRKTSRLLTIDTGFVRYGIGGEIIASTTSAAFAALKAAPVRLGLPEHPTPSSRGLVPGFYPDAQKVVREVGQMLGLDRGQVEGALKTLDEQRNGLPVDVPDPFFKGPF
jgi:pyruvate dehydrogenase E1 component beta subunit